MAANFCRLFADLFGISWQAEKPRSKLASFNPLPPQRRTARRRLRSNNMNAFRAALLTAAAACGAVGHNKITSPLPVLTWHNDVSRTGNYNGEKIPTPANVNTNSFGKLFSHATNGQIEAEPLYVPNVAVPGLGTHNVVFVATMNGYVYAFDADNASGANANPLWTSNLGPASPAKTGGGGDEFEQGIPGTPVIDPATGIMYVVCKSGSGSTAGFSLHALDIASGIEASGSPVPITASIRGKKGGVGGLVSLVPEKQYQRCALLLQNGTVFIAIGGLLGDTAPCRGWILGYDTTSLRQTYAYTTAPDAGVGSQTAFAGASIWMSGGGISSDGTYLYAATGNGDFDANTAGGEDYGDSVLKLLPTGGTLSVKDSFTPYNEATLDAKDTDLGTGTPLVIPGATTPFLLQTCKASIAYLLNRNAMGGFHATGDQVVRELQVSKYGFWSSAAYFDGRVYMAADDSQLVAYSLSSKGLAGPFGKSVDFFGHTTPTVSSNGYSNGIVWILKNDGVAQLCAYNAETLALLYKAGTRDQGGAFMKFGVPCVANGKVYVPCQEGIYVYGNGSFG